MTTLHQMVEVLWDLYPRGYVCPFCQYPLGQPHDEVPDGDAWVCQATSASDQGQGAVIMTEPIRAYHFLRADMRSGEGNEPPWAVGETRSVKGKIIPCERGYHGSPTAFDALQYAPGPVLCVVELSGDVTPHGTPTDKYAARTRTLIRARNIERELRLFAADCAEHVLPVFEREHPGDDRPRKAIEAARAYARGDIDGATLEAARDAAWAAARDAAGDAARYAARDAARDAAWDAAWAAAWAAARYAARDAAGDAAWAAARYAARDAERAWQRARFAEIAAAQ